MENVNHPQHYNILGRKECIVEMEEIFGPRAVKYFCILNAYKCRYRHSLTGCDEDIKKAEWYENYAEMLAEKQARMPKGERMDTIKRRRQNDVCTLCGIRKAVNGSVMCQKCLEKNRLRGRASYRAKVQRKHNGGNAK